MDSYSKTITVRVPIEIPVEEITSALINALNLEYITVDGGIDLKYDEENKVMYYKNKQDSDAEEYWHEISETDEELIKAVGLITDELEERSQ